MLSSFDSRPYGKVEFSLLEIEDFVTQVGFEGWCSGVSAAVKCLDNAEPTVVRMVDIDGLYPEVLPTTSIFGLKFDPFIVTTHRQSNPKWCSVITFSEPACWLVGNDVFALQTAVFDEMECDFRMAGKDSTIRVDSFRCTAANASFDLSLSVDGNTLTIPYFIERLSKYRSRMKLNGLQECFHQMPYNDEHFLESFCRSLPIHFDGLIASE